MLVIPDCRPGWQVFNGCLQFIGPRCLGEVIREAGPAPWRRGQRAFEVIHASLEQRYMSMLHEQNNNG